jgi:hypothetical protein
VGTRLDGKVFDFHKLVVCVFFFQYCHVNYDLKLQPHCLTQLFELFYQADAALSAVYSDFHGQHIAHYLVTCSVISDWIKSHPSSGTFLCPSSSVSGKIGRGYSTYHLTVKA